MKISGTDEAGVCEQTPLRRPRPRARRSHPTSKRGLAAARRAAGLQYLCKVIRNGILRSWAPSFPLPIGTCAQPLRAGRPCWFRSSAPRQSKASAHRSRRRRQHAARCRHRVVSGSSFRRPGVLPPSPGDNPSEDRFDRAINPSDRKLKRREVALSRLVANAGEIKRRQPRLQRHQRGQQMSDVPILHWRTIVQPNKRW